MLIDCDEDDGRIRFPVINSPKEKENEKLFTYQTTFISAQITRRETMSPGISITMSKDTFRMAGEKELFASLFLHSNQCCMKSQEWKKHGVLLIHIPVRLRYGQHSSSLTNQKINSIILLPVKDYNK